MSNENNSVTVIVNNKEFEVEVKDITARPLIAVVNGKEYTVQVGSDKQKVSSAPESTHKKTKPEMIINRSPNPQTSSIPALGVVTAPLPGDVVEMLVIPGDKVTAGQVICVLEAMKMKNSVRTPRDGKIASVDVTVGQSVPHGAVLVSFE